MTIDWIIRIVLFGTVHWILCIMLQYLGSRQKILGGCKAPWAVMILLLPSFGSLLYLLCHPRILARHDEDQPRDQHR
jgi:hypothetical protein